MGRMRIEVIIVGPDYIDQITLDDIGEVLEEFASGASRSRPQLAAVLARVRRGDTLMVARIDHRNCSTHSQ